MPHVECDDYYERALEALSLSHSLTHVLTSPPTNHEMYVYVRRRLRSPIGTRRKSGQSHGGNLFTARDFVVSSRIIS